MAGLVVPSGVETDEDLDRLRSELARRVRALRRSVHIRHVDAGSDGSEEWEVAALTNPVYDVQRLGIYFTASPRHADVLLVTGAGTAGMVGPLRSTFEAMPEPKVVIAAGTDAISGGLVGPRYATRAGIASVVPVDVLVPGSPPSPFSLLHAFVVAMRPLVGRGRPMTGRSCSPPSSSGRLGAVADLVAGPRTATALTPYVAAMCGSGLVAAAGVVCVLHPQGAFSLGSTLALGETSLRLDALAGLFLTLSGGLGMCVSAGLLSWAGPQGRITGRGTGAGYLLLLGSVTVVFVAGDAFTFLFAWESLTVAFYVLTGARRIDGAAARASWVTLGMGKVSGAALLLGFLLLAGRSGSLTLSSFAHVPDRGPP